MNLVDNTIYPAIAKLLADAGSKLINNQDNPDWRHILDENGFKTKADILMNDLIIDGLSNLTPNIPCFSEEIQHSITDRPSVYWLIDPIDGTSSWFGGFNGYVVQIALIKNGLATIGAIYWPYGNTTWFANSCTGEVTKNGKIICSPSKGGRKLVDNYPTARGMAKTMLESIKDCEYVECGSLSLKSVFTLTGQTDLFVKDVTIRDWDIAPAFVIADCLDGIIIDLKGHKIEIGDRIEYNNGLIISHDLDLANMAVAIAAKNRTRLNV